jgi:hypothetical protein
MTESPSALLERAAAELERRAADFGPPEYWLREVRGADMSQAGAAWAKLVGPPVASPLVELLRAARDDIAAWEPGGEGFMFDQAVRRHAPALRFARIVLGEPE